MTKFGMCNTLITFIDKYYKYGGFENINERGLTIGGYKSAWLADLVASYIFYSTKDLFVNTTLHYGICRDDGIIFLRGKWTNKNIYKWIKIFQIRANNLLDSDKHICYRLATQGLRTTRCIRTTVENQIIYLGTEKKITQQKTLNQRLSWRLICYGITPH